MIKLCSENVVKKKKEIIQVIVKDACIDEYYAIMESSSVLFFIFLFFLNNVCLCEKNCLYSTGKNDFCNLVSKLPSDFCSECETFLKLGKEQSVIPPNVFCLFFVSSHNAMGSRMSYCNNCSEPDMFYKQEQPRAVISLFLQRKRFFNNNNKKNCSYSLLPAKLFSALITAPLPYT